MAQLGWRENLPSAWEWIEHKECSRHLFMLRRGILADVSGRLSILGPVRTCSLSPSTASWTDEAETRAERSGYRGDTLKDWLRTVQSPIHLKETPPSKWPATI